MNNVKLWKACNDFQKTPVGLAKRARAVLLLAEGESFSQTSEWVGLGERHLRKWARRFTEQGVEGLQDRPRPGRVPVFPSSGVVPGEDDVCVLPDTQGRSLSQWDCTELARLRCSSRFSWEHFCFYSAPDFEHSSVETVAASSVVISESSARQSV